MNKWKTVSDFVSFSTKGITPKYVETSSIIVLNQKCIRNGSINYSLAQFTDDSKQIQESKFVQKGDILVNSTGTGTAGRCAFVENVPENYRLIVDSHILILRCNSFYEAQCLSYSLFSFEKTLMSFMTGSSGQSELDKVVLMNLKTQMPTDRINQQKIASLLSSLDSKIEVNNRINAELEAMAKTLYDYWFVQFDFPISKEYAASIGNPDLKGKPYKSSGGKMVWNEELKRKIPEEAIKIKMSELYDFQYGLGNINPDNGGQYPVYGSNGVIGSFDNYNNEDSPVIGHIGNNCGSLVFADGKHYVTYNGVMCKIKKGNDKYFGYSVLLSKDLKSHTRGSSQQFVSYDILNSLDVVMLTNKILKKYSDFINPLFDKVIVNKKENQKLTELRDWLLPMLLNGQVKVKDVDDKVELKMAAEPQVAYNKSKVR